MRKNKLSTVGMAGCFAVGSIIGNLGCSSMDRDYFLDEHGRRHEVDTSDQRLGEDFGSLLMLTPMGFLAGLALRDASKQSRQEQVAIVQQAYLRRRLYEESQRNQLRMSNSYTPQRPNQSYFFTNPRDFITHAEKKETEENPTPTHQLIQREEDTDSAKLRQILPSK